MKNSLQLVSPTPWAVSIIDEINKYFEITAPKGAMHFISKHLWSYFFLQTSINGETCEPHRKEET